jgi:hypothetical protein
LQQLLDVLLNGIGVFLAPEKHITIHGAQLIWFRFDAGSPSL